MLMSSGWNLVAKYGRGVHGYRAMQLSYHNMDLKTHLELKVLVVPLNSCDDHLGT